jgi:transposase-like protein
MPRPFPAEFRLRAVALVRAGKTITRTAEELGVSQGALHGWVRQDKIDRGELPGVSTAESAELKKAKRRIRELEMEVEILRRASKILGEDRPHPKEFPR